ncbi:MAG: hypothetical protein J5I53_08190 [Bradyrhizobiaceae bacterium]|nr:hypothetical protein [Bradyrhizobiaceae bacterium]
MNGFRTRIAPTPNGYLHLGNAVNAVITWMRARMAGGSVLLRIDDVDQSRVRREYVEDVFRMSHTLLQLLPWSCRVL